MNIQKIMALLPHRYPFLLIDRVVECTPNEKIKVLKNVTINEPFFQGHFPNNPIMPGVLIIEAMAQACCAMFLTEQINASSQLNSNEEKLTLFMGIDKARFRKPVLPGDQLIIEATAKNRRRNICQAECKAFVNDILVCEAELMAALVDKTTDLTN